MDTKDRTMEALLAEIEFLKEKAIKSEKLNESIVKTATDAIITIDRDGSILSWNPAAKRIFGYSSKEILGKNIFDVLVNNDQITKENLNRFLKTVLKRRLGQTFEFLVKRKGGEIFPTEFSVSKWELRDSNYFTGVFRDITERKRKDFLFQKLDLAIKNSKDIILMTDPKGIITYINPQFTKTYGYEFHEVVGKYTPRMIKVIKNSFLSKKKYLIGICKKRFNNLIRKYC